MIKLTLKKTSGLHTFVDHERDKNNDIVLTAETWSDMTDEVNKVGILGEGGTTREALDTMIDRYESIFEIKLILPGGETEERAREFFKALQLRGSVSFERVA